MIGTKKFAPHLFYLGTLISSTGSLTFNVCMAAFMIQKGFSLLHVSLILGGQRLLPLAISTAFGQKTDQWSPRVAVMVSEVLAAFCSIGILWSWSLGFKGYWFLVGFCLLRASVLALQAGSRAKISKILSGPDYSSNSKNAIWLNKSTQGATLFAGLIGWTSFKYLNFSWAVLIDAATFIINGIFLLSMSIEDDQKKEVLAGVQTFFQKFIDLYKYNKRAATLDLLLAMAMMGTASFTTRLAGLHQEWNPIFLMAFGLAVWASGFIERSGKLTINSGFLWGGLAIGYLLLGLFPERGWITFGFSFLKDLSYWLIFHRISSYIQYDTPKEYIGSVTIARTVQMVTILATGEILVGSWSKYVPLFWDGTWRALLCGAIVILLFVPCFKAELVYDRPNL
jgi:MFS family permease